MTPLDASALQAAILGLERELETAESPRVHAPLAESYRLQNRLEDSVRMARAGLVSYPGHISIRVVLARALDNSGRLDEATEAYREVTRLDPDNVEAMAFLEEAGTGSLIDQVENGAFEETIPEGQERPVDDGVLPKTGSLAVELEHLEGLFSTRGVDDSPALTDSLDAIATLTLAEIYAKQGLPDKALEICERILATDPDDEAAQECLVGYRRAMAEAL
ncbi:tetratricopeptide repeat protein [bacterium]|nr:tetratricopeptide repeat protein [bacterium]